MQGRTGGKGEAEPLGNDPHPFFCFPMSSMPPKTQFLSIFGHFLKFGGKYEIGLVYL